MQNGSDPVAELRRRVVDELGEDGIHPADLARINTDNQWLERFYRHQEHHMELALSMLVECLKWRIEYGVNELTPISFPRSFFEAGSLYAYTKDRENFRILMFHVKLHQKESESLIEFEHFLVYWLEQIEAERTRRVTVIFDMTDTGITNMDMEFLKFFISLFKFYYPSFLAHFLVFELPWILNTAWKLVKTWLSPKAVDKIKFVNRETILEYIAPENLPAHMGGSVEHVQICTTKRPARRRGTIKVSFCILNKEKTSRLTTSLQCPQASCIQDKTILKLQALGFLRALVWRLQETTLNDAKLLYSINDLRVNQYLYACHSAYVL